MPGAAWPLSIGGHFIAWHPQDPAAHETGMTFPAPARGVHVNRSGRASLTSSAFRDREYTAPDSTVTDSFTAPMFGQVLVLPRASGRVDRDTVYRAKAVAGSAIQLWRDLRDDRADLDTYLETLNAASDARRNRFDLIGRSRDRQANETAVAAEWAAQQTTRKNEQQTRDRYVASPAYDNRDARARKAEERGFFPMEASGDPGKRQYVRRAWYSRERLADPLHRR